MRLNLYCVGSGNDYGKGNDFHYVRSGSVKFKINNMISIAAFKGHIWEKYLSDEAIQI